MSKGIEQALKDRAFFYISPHNDLTYLDDGDILTPSIGGGAICKAFWVKDSPQHVTLLKEVYSTRDKFKQFLRAKIETGINLESILELAEGFGGKDLRKELEQLNDK